MSKQKSVINKDNQEDVIEYFTQELFHNTTVPQMLSMIEEQARNYSRAQILGDEMPESEKLKILQRMIEFNEREEKKQNEKQDN